MNATALSVSDLWQPNSGGGLPDKRTLAAIAGKCGQAWEAPDLAFRVRIAYNPRLRTTLGRAMLDENRVELNIRLLRDHPDELVPTLVHELAHLLVYWRFGRVSPHGMQFRTLMRAMNLSAKATHDLPTAAAKYGRRRYLYLHRCPCGYSFVARRTCRNYYCAACGPKMTWDIFRVPDTPQGRKMLERPAQ